MLFVYWAQKTENRKRQTGPVVKGDTIMRGYFTASGYYGLVDGRYCLFASEADYYEAMADDAA